MRRILAATFALAVALTTAACGNDDPQVLPEAGSSATRTATATPSWSATAKPQRPQDERSAEGAEAFAAFAADTVLYMMATGDVPALTSISDLASCASCKRWADSYDAGKVKKLTVSSGPATHRLVEKPSVNDDVYYQVKLALDIPPGESILKDTGKKLDTVDAAKAMPFTTNLMWKDEQWQILTYELG